MRADEPCVHERESAFPLGRLSFLAGLPCAECAAEEHAAWVESVRGRLIAGLRAAAAGEPFTWDESAQTVDTPARDAEAAPTGPGEFVLAPPPGPPEPMTLTEMTELLDRIEAAKKLMACASDVYERVRDQVYGSGLGAYFRVVENAFLKDGMVVVFDPALLEPPPFELPDDFLAPKYRCLNCFDPIHEPGHCIRCQPFADALRTARTGPPPGIIAGLGI